MRKRSLYAVRRPRPAVAPDGTYRETRPAYSMADLRDYLAWRKENCRPEPVEQMGAAMEEAFSGLGKKRPVSTFKSRQARRNGQQVAA